MTILAITQARIGSTRLPEKILKTINGLTLLEIHLRRILKSKLINKLKVATTTEPDSEKIISICNRVGVEYFQGSVNNVLERFYKTASPENPDWVIRLTSDCPLIDPNEMDRVIKLAIDNDLDYASNVLTPTFPDGIDTEVFKFSALQQAYNDASLTSEIEHVTPYIWKNSSYKGGTLFTSDCVINDTDFSDVRLTVDTAEDFLVIKNLVQLLGVEKPWHEYVRTLQDHPEIRAINEQFARNEGYEKSINKDNIV